MTYPNRASTTAGRTRQTSAAPIRLAIVSVGLATALVVATYATCVHVLRVLERKQLGAPPYVLVAFCLVAASSFLLVPAVRGLILAHRVRRLLPAAVPEARAAAARARSLAWVTIGYALAVAIALMFALFIFANNLAVGETFFNLAIMAKGFWQILAAFWINVQMFMIAEVLILAWSLVIVAARLTPGEAGAPLRLIATVYVDTFRALPAIISIYLIGFGLPLTGLTIFQDMPLMALAILALTLVYGAFVSEVYRAGIESVHPSQTAAARSLGLSYVQTMRWVVLPQAMRRMVPPLLNDFISLQKDTSLVAIIGVIDTFNQARMGVADRFNLSSVTTVAILFVVITIPQSRLVDWMVAADQRRTLAGR